MIIIGDDLISYKKINKIEIEDYKSDISIYPQNEIIFFDFDKNIAKYCFDNSVGFLTKVNNITQAIYANSFKADFIICEKELAKTLQKIAENYMFDSKILAMIENESEIEDMALSNVDGVIYKKII